MQIGAYMQKNKRLVKSSNKKHNTWFSFGIQSHAASCISLLDSLSPCSLVIYLSIEYICIHVIVVDVKPAGTAGAAAI